MKTVATATFATMVLSTDMALALVKIPYLWSKGHAFKLCNPAIPAIWDLELITAPSELLDGEWEVCDESSKVFGPVAYIDLRSRYVLVRYAAEEVCAEEGAIRQRLSVCDNPLAVFDAVVGLLGDSDD